MKKIFSIFLCLVILISTLVFDVIASDKEEIEPILLSFSLTEEAKMSYYSNERASGLITTYGLSLEKTGTVLKIYGLTQGSPVVEKCGFKNLVIQRRASSSDSWKDYYDYGDVYVDGYAANLSTTLSVVSGYQYRISCKHYAKKNIFSVETIANTSGIVTVS